MQHQSSTLLIIIMIYFDVEANELLVGYFLFVAADLRCDHHFNRHRTTGNQLGNEKKRPWFFV